MKKVKKRGEKMMVWRETDEKPEKSNIWKKENE